MNRAKEPAKNQHFVFLGIHEPILLSGVTGEGAGGAECPPPRLLTGKFLLTYREKRGKERREKG